MNRESSAAGTFRHGFQVFVFSRQITPCWDLRRGLLVLLIAICFGVSNDRNCRAAVIIDLQRRRANQAALDWLERELDSPPGLDEKRVACGCVKMLIPTLHPECAELIRRIDRDGKNPAGVGDVLGLTANNLRVRHRWTPRQLGERLEQTCRLCAKHGCLDCTCPD